MTEGSVSEWLKKPGELVRKGEMLFVVSTDKTDMEVESLDDGTLVQIVVEPGNVVPVGTVIAYLEGSGVVATSQPLPSQAAAAPPPEAVDNMSAKAAVEERLPVPTRTLSEKGGPQASPRARKVARELGLDITQVRPSGGSERIVEEDVRRFAETARPPHPG
jgi:pyruvate dehydrogenase E2 component (dihydrolipoamide acetyltransferase)